ncbi:MAG: hypothetical protein JST16_16880 [Bdellovibrionales bacterium]|nr:hypothetical protein [Bdellovibrionales bacterium]
MKSPLWLVLLLVAGAVGWSHWIDRQTPTAPATGDVSRVLVDEHGHPDAQLAEAFNSAADLLEASRLHRAPTPPNPPADAPAELVTLIAQTTQNGGNAAYAIRDYFESLPEHDWLTRGRVLRFLARGGPEWRPLVSEFSLRILETPSPDSAQGDAVETLATAAHALHDELDATAAAQLFEQIQALHVNPDVKAQLRTWLGANSSQNPQGSLNSNEHD